MSQKKQLWGISLSLCLIAGGSFAQQAPREESPEAAAAAAAMEAAMASQDGFGPTYGEQVERQQEALEEAEKAEKESESSVLATVPQDSSVDYGSIANAIFSTPAKTAAGKPTTNNAGQPKAYEDIIMTLTEPTTQSELGMGHTIDIKLRSASNLQWNFDKEYKSLEFLSSRTEDGYFHAVFKAKAPGKETIYFDCLDVGDPLNVKVLETKLLVVKVEE